MRYDYYRYNAKSNNYVQIGAGGLGLLFWILLDQLPCRVDIRTVLYNLRLVTTFHGDTIVISIGLPVVGSGSKAARHL